METVNLKFGETLISFEKKDRELMVNATEMAKTYDKRIDVFLKSEHAKAFIKELEFTPYGGNSAPLKREEIIQTRGQNGTFVHRFLAYKFAAWLNPKFELWVYKTIDGILYDYAKVQEKTIADTVRIQKELKEKKEALQKSNEDFKEILKLEEDLKKAKSTRTNATKSKFKEVHDLFNQPE